MESITTLAIIAIIYLALVAYLGFRGYKTTSSSADYMVAGRKAHPYVMALSYGATFISTSAIVGFGGAAGLFGMGLLWLTFLNIFLGIFIAFIVFGRRTRRMGHHLQAHTFPELLGRRFNSRFIQGFSGLIILLFMPLYASAVLIAGARYIENTFQVNYTVAVSVFGIVIAAYVIAGGLKGVMYADALQGSLMFVGMLVLLVFAYASLGGVGAAHRALDELPGNVTEEAYAMVEPIKEAGPAELEDKENGEVLGWFSEQANTLKSNRERINAKAKAMAELAEQETGALRYSDEEIAAFRDEEWLAVFAEDPQLEAVQELIRDHPAMAGRVQSRLMMSGIEKAGWQGWARMPKTGSPFWYVLVTSIIAGVGIGVLAQPQLAVRFMTVKSTRELNRAILVGGVFILLMTGVAFVVGNLSNVWFAQPENGGMIAFAKAGGNIDKIMPAFINEALPDWFSALFMLTLLSAAMSTLSSQFHAMGTSIGRDFFEKGILGADEHKGTVAITRIGIVVAIIGTILLSLHLPAGIVAVATAMFFGLCAAAFLPVYIGGLFVRGMTKAGAIASLLSGFGVAFLWMTFVQMPKAKLPAILADALLGKPTVLPEPIAGVHWNWVEALFVALPVSALVAIVVSLFTKPEPESHLRLCYEGVHDDGAGTPAMTPQERGPSLENESERFGQEDEDSEEDQNEREQ
jgi:Na+/proline symporter